MLCYISHMAGYNSKEMIIQLYTIRLCCDFLQKNGHAISRDAVE